MAAETVAAFTPIPFHQDSIGNFCMDEDHHVKCVSEDESEKHLHTGTNLYEENTHNQENLFHNFKSVDHNQLDKLKTFEEKELKDSQIRSNGVKFNADIKKKRNIRKRNRCDMSPEELRKLRERERKAQQNRRDRIRAQKRQAQGWHDDDAAWEAFLDQTDNNSNDSSTKRSSKKQTRSVPSMVCGVSTQLNPLKNGDPRDSPYSILSDSSQNSEKNDSHATDAHEMFVNGDLSNNEKEQCETKISTDEYASKQHQRETYSAERNDSHSRIRRRDSGSPLSSDETKEYPRETPNRYTSNKSNHHLENKHYNSDCKLSDDMVSPKSRLSPSHVHNLTSPHHFPSPHMHYPVVYIPESHRRHYSPSGHYLKEHHYPDMYYPRHLTEERYLPKENLKHDTHHHSTHYHEYQKNHLLSPHAFHRVLPSPGGPYSTSPETRNLEIDPYTPEKKKMISRNVDRKKLSEDELEELRRRERDYQRERRARIRMEKAKSQASHDQYQHKYYDEDLPHYFNHSPLYNHEGHEKLPHIRDRYESIQPLDCHKPSPNHTIKTTDDDHHKVYSFVENKELEVAIPSESRSYTRSINETELLQVVPKTRECEDMKVDNAPPSNGIESPDNHNTNKSPAESKKSVLENICSSLKKSPDWNDEEINNDDLDDEKLVIVQPSTELDVMESTKEGKESTVEKVKEERDQNKHMELWNAMNDRAARDKIAEDQLERRRRSNREAQRRRRARLKMLGNTDERPETMNQSNDSNDTDTSKEKMKINNENPDEESEHLNKQCRMKVTPSRPDSLYGKELHSHRHQPVKQDRHHDKYFLHEKYPYHEKRMMYPPSYHSMHEYDELHHSHFFHEPPPYVSERYLHEYPDYYHNYRNRRPQYQRHHCTLPERSQKPERHDVSMLDKANQEHCLPSDDVLDDSLDQEPMKFSGRKRKQCAPRRVVASSSSSPEEDIDVCNVTESPGEEEMIIVPLVEEPVIHTEGVMD